MNKFFKWLVLSSSNPTKISLTIKGFLTSVVAMAVIFGYNPSDLSPIAENITKLVESLLTVVGIVSFLVGAIRKVKKTSEGTNPVLY